MPMLSISNLSMVLMKLLLFGSQLLSVSVATKTHHEGNSATLENANHIFNAIHHAVRQLGSTLEHNGMSFAIVTVPEHTEFYHGTSSAFRVNDTEWLAFDPEHAMNFAYPHWLGNPWENKSVDTSSATLCSTNDAQQFAFSSEDLNRQSEQSVIKPRQGDAVDTSSRAPAITNQAHRVLPRYKAAEKGTVDVGRAKDNLTWTPPLWFILGGYLHTYRTKHALRLLYLDGQSAAKSSLGTLDAQDIILLNDTSPNPNFVEKDYVRAAKFCELAKDDWQGRIDGVLRMEDGFEVILCNFSRSLEIVDIIKPEIFTFFGGESYMWSHDLAIAARSDGIGGGRATVGFDSYVSAYSYPDLVFKDDQGRPRIDNTSAHLDQIREDIRDMILRPSSRDHTKWQAVTDMIVTRYAERLALLCEDLEESLFRQYLRLAMLPFISYIVRDTSAEIERCEAQFWPQNAIDTSPALAVKTVIQRICTTLSRAGEEKDFMIALKSVRNLKAWLNWSKWRECRGCRLGEFCMLPHWPIGIKEDFEHLQCGNATTHWNRWGYWG